MSAYTLVVTAAADRRHSRSSLHHSGAACDLDVIDYAGVDVIFAHGVRMVGVQAAIWFVISLARSYVASLAGPLAAAERLKALANYLDTAVGEIDVEALYERDHVHIEFQPKQRAIDAPSRIRETVNAAGGNVPAADLDRIVAALIALRHDKL